MSILSELHNEDVRLLQEIMDTWADFKERNDRTENDIAEMESQVESKEWKELKK